MVRPLVHILLETIHIFSPLFLSGCQHHIMAQPQRLAQRPDLRHRQEDPIRASQLAFLRPGQPVSRHGPGVGGSQGSAHRCYYLWRKETER